MPESTVPALLHSIDETARLLGNLSPWSIRRFISQSRIKAVRIGSRVMVSQEEIENVVKNGIPPLP